MESSLERNIESDCIVLTSKKWGAMHKRVTLLSKELGLFDAIIYGGQKGKLSSASESCTPLHAYLYYVRSKEEYTLKDVTISYDIDNIKGDLTRHYTSQACVEIILKMHGGDYSELYDLLLSSILLLNEIDVTPMNVLIQYMYRVIGIMGLMSDLHICSLCDNPYKEEEIVYVHPIQNIFCCTRCFDEASEPYKVRFSPGMMRYLRFTHHLSIQEAVKVVLSEAATKKIVYALVDYMNIILGYSLKSLMKSFLLI